MNEAQISPKVSMFKADEASPINYARVVILGDVGVEKTALVKVISVFSLIFISGYNFSALQRKRTLNIIKFPYIHLKKKYWLLGQLSFYMAGSMI